MIPKRIELENFLSFGKPAVVITFTDEEPLWVLCGRNGAGKSAIFDGITYALYGEHRGGAQKAEQLIRHGANSFRVVFDFEFAGVEYRITRSRASKTTQKVEARLDGAWQAVAGVNAAPDVKAWVEKILGLGYKAFTTSVLLRQGEADKLFSASRDERIGVLKRIIGFERFEEVARQVHTATAKQKNALERIQQQKNDLLPVTPEELALADATLTDAETKRQQSQTDLTTAAQRAEQAKQWQSLETKRAEFDRQLADADQRAQDAAAIRADKLRLDDLTTAIPLLQALLSLRDRIADLEPKLTSAASERDQTAAAIEVNSKAAGQAQLLAEGHKEKAAQLDRQAKALAEEVERGTKFLDLANAIEQLKTKLTAYPTDLIEQVAQAEAQEKAASDAMQHTTNQLAAAEALWKQAQQQQTRFADVKIGVSCSLCGQPVDETHAKKERLRLTMECQARQKEVEQLGDSAKAAANSYASVRQQRSALQTSKKEFDGFALQLKEKRGNLTQFGGVADANELRARLEQQRKQKSCLEKQADDERTKQRAATQQAARLDAERTKLDTKHKTSLDAIRALETNLQTQRAQHDAKREQLTPEWQASLPHLDAGAVSSLAQERDRLQQAGVSDRYKLLLYDEAKRAEWEKQRANLQAELDRIPADARISAQEASRRQEQAGAILKAANRACEAAAQALSKSKAQAEEHQRLTKELKTVERQHDLHKKLDDLLGQNGLQRELVRDAEQQIVALANETLLNLSDGDLSLEQDDDVTGRDDKAFALRVRRAGDPLPIGVMFLSGSQKFRVAVSVALAIGRFASGRARPLEAVIIDEGFGSLDKDGLRTMAEELKRLQQSLALKRVVLVSHQEEFTDQFPVGYQLHPTDSGTTATPFRR